jgi:serine/threonine protein kinase
LHNKTRKLSETQLQTILSYSRNLLHTLQEYHEAGLWHKDVKPDNIIIHDGSAHLVDLGLVTPLASAMTLTTHGTEYFRDPELVRQAMRGVKVHQVDGSKFDVFGAGAVLYFMLENTFPAHGCLSDFNKESPECIRWIVRRAMADYDKRYNTVEEMLRDVETVLRAKTVSGVRPADLPSMGGEPPKAGVRRLPSKSTPSTGGGPFKPQQYKTSPFGLFFLLILIAGGASLFIDKNHTDVEPSPILMESKVPEGKILVLSDLITSSNMEAKKTASNKIAELGVAGWELFVDADKEASVRSWLPSNPTSTPVPPGKFEAENIYGILFIQEGDGTIPEIHFINQNGAHVIP